MEVHLAGADDSKHVEHLLSVAAMMHLMKTNLGYVSPYRIIEVLQEHEDFLEALTEHGLIPAQAAAE
jgi:hypothetical protein